MILLSLSQAVVDSSKLLAPPPGVTQPTATLGAALLSSITSIVAALLAYNSNSTASATKKALKIRQVRMDERDLIMDAGGFLIPIENDAMWRDYQGHMRAALLKMDPRAARKDASDKVRLTLVPNQPDARIGDALT